MNKIRLTPAAARDLADIQSYIAEELGNRAAAARTVKRITAKLRVLQRYAEAGPSVMEITGEETDLRMLVCGQYIALYRVENRIVSVARIVQGRQDYMRVLFHNND